MALKGAIFDLDGVIVDTVPLHFNAWKKMFAEYGHEFTFEEYKKKVDGIPRIDGARAVLNTLSREALEKAAARKQSYFLELLAREGVTVYQSTLALIGELKKNGIKVAVISSSKNCLDILKKAGLVELFDVILTGNDVHKGKPNPDVFLIAASKLGLVPQECVVFEDAVLGVEAARKGGFACVGIDRYENPKRLQGAGLIVKDLSETRYDTIKELVKK